MEYCNIKNISFNLYTYFLNFSSEPSGTSYYFWSAEWIKDHFFEIRFLEKNIFYIRNF